VGVGALLVLLASRVAGSGDSSSSSSSSSSKKGPGRTARAPSSTFDLGFSGYNSTAGYGTAGSRAAAARAKATDVAHSLADQSVSLENALSAMPSWFLSNIKTVAGGHNHGHYKGTSSSNGSRAATNGSSRGRGGDAGGAAAPAGVMGYDDGVLYAAGGSNWGGAGPSGSTTAARKHQGPGVSDAAVWGPQGSALLAPADGGSDVLADAAGAGAKGPGGRRAGGGQQGGALSDAEQQQLQVLYRSLSNVPGSWH
jgi:hypothetical protein